MGLRKSAGDQMKTGLGARPRGAALRAQQEEVIKLAGRLC